MMEIIFSVNIWDNIINMNYYKILTWIFFFIYVCDWDVVSIIIENTYSM